LNFEALDIWPDGFMRSVEKTLQDNAVELRVIFVPFRLMARVCFGNV